MSITAIAIGANQGDIQSNFSLSFKLINQKAGNILAISKLYRTAPVGFLDQPEFQNGALIIQTTLNPFKLLSTLQDIEIKVGRVRTFKNGPRILDLDILLFDNISLESDSLTIPHPRMIEREFVLRPLNDVAPFWKVHSQTVREHLQDASSSSRVKDT